MMNFFVSVLSGRDFLKGRVVFPIVTIELKSKLALVDLQE